MSKETYAASVETPKRSIIENIKGHLTPASPPKGVLIARDVATKLAEAAAALSALRDGEGALALSALYKEAGAEARLDDLQKQIAEQTAKVTALRAALKAAEQRDAAIIRGERANMAKMQLNAVKKALTLRDAAAEALSLSIAESVAQWKILVEQSIRAKQCNPVGGEWPAPNDDFYSVGGLRKMVAHELHRLGADPKMVTSFPGGVTDDLNNLAQPDKTPAMAPKLKANSEMVVGTLSGKIWVG